MNQTYRQGRTLSWKNKQRSNTKVEKHWKDDSSTSISGIYNIIYDNIIIYNKRVMTCTTSPPPPPPPSPPHMVVTADPTAV